jgi:2,3-bisphosphoglycerate-independent phosphoglycerate mutase
MVTALQRLDSGGLDGPLLLVVMDGVGVGRLDAGDAVWLARTPTLDRLAAGPHTTLLAHGTAVGMPSDGDMGNSEVGHNALGAGRVFDQGAKLVDAAIRSGSMFEGDAWKSVVGPCAGEGTLHFVGLLSDGNVHSHEDHLHAMIRRAASDGCRSIRVHILLDGRDVAETSALTYIDRLEAVLGSLGEGTFCIASGGGRMKVTMDRYEADWGMVETGWSAHVHGDGRRFGSAREAVETFRTEDRSATDQFLPAFVIADDDGPLGAMQDGDGVVFFNYRGDRAIEISRAFVEDGFDAFDRGRRPRVRYAGMMQYDGDTQMPPTFLVDPPAIDRSLSEHLASSGVSQWACAETQKFGHVTYFWNGNRSSRFDGETWLEVPSDNVPFEQRPWMKAAEVTDATIAALTSPNPPSLLRINYANGDMVGHTGKLDPTVLAVEAVDLCIARLLPVLDAIGGAALITADHGNADQMFQIDKKSDAYKGTPLTSHTLNPVPLFLHDRRGRFALRDGGGLANIAATTLELMGFGAPDDYARSLLR